MGVRRWATSMGRHNTAALGHLIVACNPSAVSYNHSASTRPEDREFDNRYQLMKDMDDLLHRLSALRPFEGLRG
jgi:hypothetical protein